MKSQFVFAGALCLAGLVASAAHAGVTINGTTIQFNDATVQTTAYTGGGGSAPADHGGSSNSVSGTDSFIGGGYSNLVTDDYGTISGGYENTASGNNSTVSGGRNNECSGTWFTF